MLNPFSRRFSAKAVMSEASRTVLPAVWRMGFFTMTLSLLLCHIYNPMRRSVRDGGKKTLLFYIFQAGCALHACMSKSWAHPACEYRPAHALSHSNLAGICFHKLFLSGRAGATTRTLLLPFWSVSPSPIPATPATPLRLCAAPEAIALHLAPCTHARVGAHVCRTTETEWMSRGRDERANPGSQRANTAGENWPTAPVERRLRRLFLDLHVVRHLHLGLLERDGLPALVAAARALRHCQRQDRRHRRPHLILRAARERPGRAVQASVARARFARALDPQLRDRLDPRRSHPGEMREMCEIRASCCRLPLLACHAHGSSAASVLVALAERAFFFRLHGQEGLLREGVEADALRSCTTLASSTPLSIVYGWFTTKLRESIIRDVPPPMQAAVLTLVQTNISAMRGAAADVLMYLSTPVPLAYTSLLEFMVTIYVLMAPLGLVPRLLWMAVPGCFVVTLIFYGFMSLGKKMLNPFTARSDARSEDAFDTRGFLLGTRAACREVANAVFRTQKAAMFNA
uniref:Uncharacterized protein n=1 Tax=Chrysotila carterae TaxID=13221 RepID=A0A7S4BFB7_CHRCT